MPDPRTIIIDFETYFDKASKYSLRHLSYPEFINDARFKVLGLAIDDGTGQRFLKPSQIPAFLKTVQNDILVMHNAFFDAGILTWHYKYRPAYMVDTLLLANHIFGSARDQGGKSNDLASLATRLGLEAKGKIEFMDGVRDPDEAQLASLAAYAKQDAKLERQVFEILLPQVTNPEFEFWLLDHTLRIYTEKPLGIDLAKVLATKLKVEARRKELVTLAGVDEKVLNSNTQFAALLALRMKEAKLKVPTKRAAPRKDGSTPTIPALAKGDSEFIALADSPVKSVSDLVKARLVVRSAVTIAARLATMEKYANLGLGIPVHLVYYGAHTGRFSGGGGFSFHNLTSPARAADPIEREIAEMVRDCITPHPTDKSLVLVAVDASQIEARVLAWLAGQDDILEAFANGADIYSMFISHALNEDIHKPTDADKADPKRASYLSLMRQVGKEAILGLGYSMGVDKFRMRLRKEKNLVPMLEKGGKLSEEVCQTIVTGYREKYDKIVDYWDSLNKAFIAAISGSTRRVGKLLFKRIGPRAVSITLPSGRQLFYRELRQVEETMPNGNRRKVWKHGSGQRIYGGLLAENVTQAIARDILVEAIQASEAEGHPVALHVHDEIVARVSEVQGQNAHDFLVKALSTPPMWGAGLVLGAEGHISHTLSK